MFNIKVYLLNGKIKQYYGCTDLIHTNDMILIKQVLDSASAPKSFNIDMKDVFKIHILEYLQND